jgi:hypothetical protein
MKRKSQEAEQAFEEERAKLKTLIEQEYQERAAELRRSLAIVRSELGGILAEEARRLAEERRQEFEEKERRAATEYSIRLHQVQQRVEERLAEWAQDLERLETGLAGAISRVEERQREQLQDVHRQVKQEIEEIALETREHKATVLRFRDEAQRAAKEAIDAATSDLEDVAAQRRQALQEVSDRLGARERELLKRVDREEAEATTRMEAKFADVERRQIERLQRSLEHEASRLLEDAAGEFQKTVGSAQEDAARRLARELERAVTGLSSKGERLLRREN